MPSDGILIRGARQLLTLRGFSGPRRGAEMSDLGIIQDGAILIRSGIIQDVGPSRRLENLASARNAEEIDATGCVVMPSFVDLETSMVHARPPARSLERLLAHYDSPDIGVFRDVLDDGARSLSSLTSHALRRRGERVAQGMARHGTGTAESRAGYHVDEAGVLKILRVQKELNGATLGVSSTLALNLPPGADSSEWGSCNSEHLLPLVRRRRLASLVDVEYDRGDFPASAALHLLQVAAQMGFSIKTHAGFLSRSSAVPLAVLAGTTSVGDLRFITPDEIGLLSNSSVIAVLRPGGLLQMGMSHAAPGRKMLDRGVMIAVASGYHAELSPGYNMQLMLVLASRLYAFRPEESIVAATINAAYAIGAGSAVGSLEPGKQADVIMLEVPDYREIAHHAGVNIVSMTMKRGVIVHRVGLQARPGYAKLN